MVPRFHEGQHVYFASTVHARTTASPGGSIVIINQGAKGAVNGYSRGGTGEDTSNDFVGIEITEGDEAEGQIV